MVAMHTAAQRQREEDQPVCMDKTPNFNTVTAIKDSSTACTTLRTLLSSLFVHQPLRTSSLFASVLLRSPRIDGTARPCDKPACIRDHGDHRTYSIPRSTTYCSHSPSLLTFHHASTDIAPLPGPGLHESPIEAACFLDKN